MIRSFFKLLALTLVSAVASFAQIPVTNVEDWRIIEPIIDEFTISSPGEMKVIDSGDPEFPRKYGILANGTYLFVLSNPLDSSFWLRDVEKFLNDSNQSLPKLAKLDKPMRISFKDQFGFYNDLLFTRTENRFYMVHTLSETENDAIAKRFLSSFRLVSKPFIGEESDTIEIEPKKTPIPEISPKLPRVGGGNGIADATSNDSSAGKNSNPSTISAQVKTNSPLTLLSMPRPAYTDVARFYGVSGFVDLRINFLSSGQIESISRMKKLPFGLTEQAIDAAKRIQFEPAYSKGNPITVTKIVQYTFTIYECCQ